MSRSCCGRRCPERATKRSPPRWDGGRLRLPDPETLAAFYTSYGPDRLGLADRGYLAGLPPLELWLVGYLAAHPRATFDEAFEASRVERIEVYRWLFRSKHKAAQDKRIRSELERDAFAEIHEQWRQTGYPFESLVPSFATAIGTSADRPSALAELAGILLNDGVRQPTRRLERIAFAEGTPYETRLVPVSPAPQRVLQSEVAAAVRSALLDVVEGGTARRAVGSIKAPDGGRSRSAARRAPEITAIRRSARAGGCSNRASSAARRRSSSRSRSASTAW